jgi:hypothetical protein
VHGIIRFRAQLQQRGPAAAVVPDESQVAAVGEGARRFPAVATVNGYTWRTSVARMGGEFLVRLNRQVRDGAGDQAEVTIELVWMPREVQVPEALAAALAADPQAAASFEQMAFTHRKEYARWIAEAKRAETRQRRVAQALEMIRPEDPFLTAHSSYRRSPGVPRSGSPAGPAPRRRPIPARHKRQLGHAVVALGGCGAA